jgi:hypothetical protein
MAIRRAMLSLVTKRVIVLVSALRMPGLVYANFQFSSVNSPVWPGMRAWKLLNSRRNIG